MTLYNYFRSSTSYRIRIALNIKGLPYEYRAVHLLNNGGEHHSAEYRKLNSLREVPTLVVEGQAISQSMAILEYLEDVFPKVPLLPKDPVAKAKVRQFCENINCGIHPVQNLKVIQYLERDLGHTEEERKKWIAHWVRLGLQSLEESAALSAGLYCFGDTVSAADVFLIPQLFSAARFQVPLDDFVILRKIEAQCLKDAAFVKAHPFRQPDTPAEARLP